MESLICNLYLSVATCKIVWASGTFSKQLTGAPWGLAVSVSVLLYVLFILFSFCVSMLLWWIVCTVMCAFQCNCGYHILCRFCHGHLHFHCCCVAVVTGNLIIYNNNNNNNRIQRCFSRFFTISSQRRELFPTCTLKWPGSNRVQITCNTSSTYHVQVSCYMPLGTKGQLSY